MTKSGFSGRKIVYILVVIRRLNFYIGGSYRAELRRCSKF